MNSFHHTVTSMLFLNSLLLLLNIVASTQLHSIPRESPGPAECIRDLSFVKSLT